MSFSLNSLKGGSTGDYIRECYKILGVWTIAHVMRAYRGTYEGMYWNFSPGVMSCPLLPWDPVWEKYLEGQRGVVIALITPVTRTSA